MRGFNLKFKSVNAEKGEIKTGQHSGLRYTQNNSDPNKKNRIKR